MRKVVRQEWWSLDGKMFVTEALCAAHEEELMRNRPPTYWRVLHGGHIDDTSGQQRWRGVIVAQLLAGVGADYCLGALMRDWCRRAFGGEVTLMDDGRAVKRWTLLAGSSADFVPKKEGTMLVGMELLTAMLVRLQPVPAMGGLTKIPGPVEGGE